MAGTGRFPHFRIESLLAGTKQEGGASEVGVNDYHLQDLATRPEQLSSLREQLGVLR
jgi:hypothetical protein